MPMRVSPASRSLVSWPSAAHDRGDNAPGHPQKHRDHTEGGVGGQPRGCVLKSPGMTGAGPRPGQVGHPHSMLGAGYPRCCRLQIGLRRLQIQAAPAPDPVPAVIGRTAFLAPRAPAGLVRLGPHLKHQHLTGHRRSATRSSTQADATPRFIVTFALGAAIAAQTT